MFPIRAHHKSCERSREDSMTSRLLALTGALALVLGGLAVALHAQSGRNTSNPKKEFRTLWGDPNLEGNWDGQTLTPLQRPARFANKPVLTPEEAAKVVAEVLGRPGQDRRSSNPEKDVQGAYNALFNQRSSDLS